MWVAGKLLQIARGGKLVAIPKGEPVPEVDGWSERARAVCERQERIVWKDDPEPLNFITPSVIKRKRGRPAKQLSMEV
jgi:hypothetical protein